MGVLGARSKAIAKGLDRYFTGKPCKHGHVAERWIDGGCFECRNLLNLSYYRRNSKKVIARVLQNYRENPSRKIAQITKWVIENREKVRKNHRRWSRANSGKVLANTRNQRARRQSAPGKHTANDIQEIYNRQSGLCIYCKCNLKNKYHVDHIVALINGGGNDKSNLQITCQSCNHRKHAKDPIDFAREIGIIL